MEGTISINYFREKDKEIDFIVHTDASNYLPIEVKYRENIQDTELRTITNFCKRFKLEHAIVVTKKWSDYRKVNNLLYLPLPHFLLLFD